MQQLLPRLRLEICGITRLGFSLRRKPLYQGGRPASTLELVPSLTPKALNLCRRSSAATITGATETNHPSKTWLIQSTRSRRTIRCLLSMSSAQSSVDAPQSKRKQAPKKFYAVRAGHRPGIYHSWDECSQQVKGFKGAQFKSFPSLSDAELFVAGKDPSAKRPHSGPTKFYAVRRGQVPGIYLDWPSAQQQITGFSKPSYKSFSTRAEAQEFIDRPEPKTAEEAQGEDVANSTGEATAEGIDGLDHKRRKTEQSPHLNGTEENAGDALAHQRMTGYLPPGTTDGFDTNIILDSKTGTVVYKNAAQKNATKLQAVGSDQKGPIVVHTDGSSLRNGQTGAFAGVGVYFGPSDPRNISDSLPGARQTNQRAELTAVLRALETIPKDRWAKIVTDSEYTINCVTKWHVGWKKKGWKTAAGKNVENRDLVEAILGKIEERDALESKTEFEWVKGHADNPGNIGADYLAVNGARRAAKLALEE